MKKESGDDTKLVRRSLDGDTASYGSLVEKYSPRILGLARMMLGDPHEAEDVAQEAFVRAYRALSGFEQRAKFSSWLYRIALNLCRDRLKSRGRSMKSLDGQEGWEEGDTRFSATRHVLASELSSVLQDAIQRLPALYREVFVLRHLQNIEYDEISQISQVPEDTVRVRAFRARELLKESLGPAVDTCWREKEGREKAVERRK